MSDDKPVRILLREFRLFRDATAGRLSSLEASVRELTLAVVELNKTVRSVPGLIDLSVETDQNMRVLEARLHVVEEELPRKKNGGSTR